MTKRHSREIVLNVPVKISLFPKGLYSDADPKTIERAWQIIDELSERDLDNALGAILNEYEDGRAPLSVELVQREVQKLIEWALHLVLQRRAREKYPESNTERMDSTKRSRKYKQYAKRVAGAKFEKVYVNTQVGHYDSYAARNAVDPMEGNVFDGMW